MILLLFETRWGLSQERGPNYFKTMVLHRHCWSLAQRSGLSKITGCATDIFLRLQAHGIRTEDSVSQLTNPPTIPVSCIEISNSKIL